MKTGLALGVAVLGLMVPASAGAANPNIWTTLDTGTSERITGVEYQSESRFWFVTGGGDIYKRSGNGFTRVLDGSAPGLTDIEFQPGGQVGLATGQNGKLLRSTDGGEHWDPITLDPIANNFTCSADQPMTDRTLYSVRFAAADKAYLFATNRTVLRSEGSTTTVGESWENANSAGASGCGDAGEVNASFGDGFFVPGTNVAYFQGDSSYLYTRTDTGQTYGVRPARACTTQLDCRLAGDPADPNRQWAATGFTLYVTKDGWETESGITRTGDGQDPAPDVVDVTYAGGTTVAAGKAGAIVTSTDGTSFSPQPAAGFETNEWVTADMYDGDHAAVGGAGGVLVVTTQASFTPDFKKPTVTVSGPRTATTGVPVTFTADVTDEGPSGVPDAGVVWSAPNAPAPVSATGRSVTLTFPTAGSYTLRVKATDNAGNESLEVAYGVTVTDPTPPPVVTPPDTRPEPTLRFTGGKPKVTTVKKGGKVYVVIKVNGYLGVPAGVNKALACKGQVYATVTSSKKLITGRNIKLDKQCRYKRTIRFLRKKLKVRRVVVRVRFNGNAYLKGEDIKATIKIKKQF